MRTSDAVRDAMLRFYDRISASDVGSFESLVSRDPATLVIGTAPGEWITERHRLRYGFEAEGLRITPGDAVGYEEGSLGMHTRLTAILKKEDGDWRLVHMHLSVGVPDEEVVQLQKRLGT